MPDDKPVRRSRRRSYARSKRTAPPLVFVKHAAGPSPQVKGAVVEIDITRAGPFGNPFPMGLFDSNGTRRRQCVALYKQWLDARPATRAADLLIGGSEELPRIHRPSGRWRDRTATDVMSACQRLVEANPDTAAFSLVCSRSCRGKLPHPPSLFTAAPRRGRSPPLPTAHHDEPYV